MFWHFGAKERIIRIFNDEDFYDHTESLFKKSGVLKLIVTYELNVAVHLFENNLFEDFCSNYSYHTRHALYLVPDLQRLTTTQHSTKLNGPLIWNPVPDPIKRSATSSLFKFRYKKHLLDS